MADSDVAVLGRVCTRCHEQKPATLEFFTPHKLGRYGLHSLCRPCKKLDDAARRARSDQQARQQAWRDANKEAIRSANAAYRKAGYCSTNHVKRWIAANPDRAAVLAKRRIETRKAKIEYQIKTRTGARLRMMIADKGGRRTEDLMGFTSAALRRHIERQFTKGMTWEAFLKGKIHIDHIVPVSAFSIKSVDDPDFRVCWALSNLRPMWAKDNLAKGAKRLTLL